MRLQLEELASATLWNPNAVFPTNDSLNLAVQLNNATLPPYVRNATTAVLTLHDPGSNSDATLILRPHRDKQHSDDGSNREYTLWIRVDWASVRRIMGRPATGEHTLTLHVSNPHFLEARSVHSVSVTISQAPTSLGADAVGCYFCWQHRILRW